MAEGRRPQFAADVHRQKVSESTDEFAESSFGGGSDAFVATFGAGRALGYASFHRGSKFDAAVTAALLPGGRVLFGGEAQSDDMPTPSYDNSFNGGRKDGMVGSSRGCRT